MIRNIIFDFGGVIYDIDHKLSELAFKNLGVGKFDQLYGHEIQTKIFEDLEIGKLNEKDFITHLMEVLPKNTSYEDIEDAWNALLLGFEPNKIDLLKEISGNYQLFLLSNSNIIHYKRYIKELEAYTDFRSIFKDVWYSHEKGMRKPDDNFYLELLKQNNLKAEECLFIDDLEKNIVAAKQLGIQTHYLVNENIIDLFENGFLKK